MKRLSILPYFIYLFASVLFACTTGKNALQKGDYDASIGKAVNRLQNAPKNAEAAEVLKTAYNLSYQDHLRRINEAKMARGPFYWETVLYAYQKINQTADLINACPACLAVVPSPPKYIKEVEESRFNAAVDRYNSGLAKLSINNKLSAKAAYFEFEKAKNLQPNYKDVIQKMDDAYWAAVTRVVVQPIILGRSPYQLSADYFQQQINQFIASYAANKFVVFYDEQQANEQKIIPDQVLSLNFDDFVVGQTYVKEKIEKLERDSVLIGETKEKKPVYGTVKATLSIVEKNISSSGLLDMSITDWHNRKLVYQQKFPGTYVWQNKWATYKGDDRALNDAQLALTKRKESLPPPPNELFLSFTKPIYSQLVEVISQFYSSY